MMRPRADRTVDKGEDKAKQNTENDRMPCELHTRATEEGWNT